MIEFNGKFTPKIRASKHTILKSPFRWNKSKFFRDYFIKYLRRYISNDIIINDNERCKFKSYTIDRDSGVLNRYIPYFILLENRFNTQSFLEDTLENNDISDILNWFMTFSFGLENSVLYFYENELIYLSGNIGEDLITEEIDSKSLFCKKIINNFKKICNNKKYSIYLYTYEHCNDITFKIQLRPEYLYKNILTNNINDIMDKMLVIEC